MDLLSGNFHAHFLSPDRIPVALSALLLTAIAGAVMGPLSGNANPLIWNVYSSIFGPFGDRLDRARRTRSDLLFRGFLVTALVVFVSIIIGNFIESIVISKPYYGITEILILSCFMTSGAAWRVLFRLYTALEGKKVEPGTYLAVSRSTRTNLSIADNYSITRVAMGFSARAFDKGLVAPVFWYLLGGLPVVAVYTALAGLAWRFGKDGFTKGFGLVPLTLEKIMGFAPDLLAGLYIALAGLFTPTAGMTRGFLSFFGHKNRAGYEQGGYALSALSWSLNLSLGGASQDLSGSAIQSTWVGPDKATAQNDHTHLRRAIYISLMAHLLLAASLGGLFLWLGRHP